jgi:hypothetical protein
MTTNGEAEPNAKMSRAPNIKHTSENGQMYNLMLP